MNNKNLIQLAQRVRGFADYTEDNLEFGKSIELAYLVAKGEDERDQRQEMNMRQSISEIDEDV